MMQGAGRRVLSLHLLNVSLGNGHPRLHAPCTEYRELAEESGIENWGRVPALNTNQLFIDDLADAVLEALPYVGMVAKPSDALVPQGACVGRVGQCYMWAWWPSPVMCWYLKVRG
eukprot:1154243-Pelagomonas_calceolata.AAC.1